MFYMHCYCDKEKQAFKEEEWAKPLKECQPGHGEVHFKKAWGFQVLGTPSCSESLEQSMEVGVRTWKALNARQRHLDQLMRGVRATEGLSGVGDTGGWSIWLTLLQANKQTRGRVRLEDLGTGNEKWVEGDEWEGIRGITHKGVLRSVGVIIWNCQVANVVVNFSLNKTLGILGRSDVEPWTPHFFFSHSHIYSWFSTQFHLFRDSLVPNSWTSFITAWWTWCWCPSSWDAGVPSYGAWALELTDSVVVMQRS